MDFSEYSGISDEFAAIWANENPLPVLPIPDLQQLVNKTREDASAAQMQILRPQVLTQDVAIPTRDGYHLNARTYRSRSLSPETSLPIFLYFHGGGFLFGTLDSEDATCSRIALGAEVVVINVNYRHTPEWTYPTAWNDSEDAYEYIVAHAPSNGDARRIVVGGISAGGQLAASLTQRLNPRESGNADGRLKGQILMIPCLVHPDCYASQLARLKDPGRSSYMENEHAPVLSLSLFRKFCSLLTPEGPPSLDDRRINPGNASTEEVKGLPPTVIGIAGLDPLRDEALLYAKLLAESGVATSVHLFKGVPHGFRRFGDRVKQSADWDRVIVSGIQWALEGPEFAEGEGRVDVY